MTVAPLTEVPLAPAAELGPYRRQDYEGLPGEPRCELIYGRLYVSPSPNPRHQVVVMALWSVFHHIARETGGIAFAAPLDVHLAEHSVVQPDVIYVRAANRGIVGERIEGAPDLFVEVLSPGTSRRDRGEKLALYAEAGIKEYWIVDPAERQIEFLVNEAGRFLVALPAGREYRSQALEEIRLDLVDFWTEVDETLRGA
jgi:Uma2 family endonuclease